MKKGNLSYIRLIATMMIISCHILQGLNLEAAFWLNLGVQIFFVLSGYLYSQKQVNDAIQFYKKQYFKIMLPVIIVTIIMTGILFFRNVEVSKLVVLGNLLGFQAFVGSIPNLSHLWFVSYILLCYLITPIIEKVIKKEKFSFLLFKLVLITIIMQLFVVFKVININVTYIMLYIFGYCYGYNKKEYENKNENKIIVFFAVITLITLPLRLIVQYSNLNIASILQPALNLITSYHHALCGITIFLLLKKILANMQHTKFLIMTDKYCYYIYVVHQIFILNDFSLLNKTSSLILNILLILICTLISAILLNIVIEFIKKIISLIKKKKTLLSLTN